MGRQPVVAGQSVVQVASRHLKAAATQALLVGLLMLLAMYLLKTKVGRHLASIETPRTCRVADW
jgi:hypothetical protein